MTKNTGKDEKRRTRINALPQPEKELSAEEQKRVKGGRAEPAAGEAMGTTGGDALDTETINPFKWRR